MARAQVCLSCREADLVQGDRSIRLQIDKNWKALLSLTRSPQLGSRS